LTSHHPPLSSPLLSSQLDIPSLLLTSPPLSLTYHPFSSPLLSSPLLSQLDIEELCTIKTAFETLADLSKKDAIKKADAEAAKAASSKKSKVT
jgi:hypothetical protein